MDYVVDGGMTREAHTWADRFLIPTGYIGRLIYEPMRTGNGAQGEHIHMAPRDDMVAAFGPSKGDIQSLEERAEGEYVFARLGLGAVGLGLVALVFFPWRPRAGVGKLCMAPAPSG